MIKFNSSTIAIGTLVAFGAIAPVVQAGESYVSNTFTNTVSKTKTDLYMNSNEWSHGSREWFNYAYKEYYDGSVATTVDGSFETEIALTGTLDGTFEGTVDGTVVDAACFDVGDECVGQIDFNNDEFSGTTSGTTEGDIALSGTSSGFADSFTTTSDYDGFTFHTALASEVGSEEFGSNTSVYGTINNFIFSISNSHETAAGNR